MTALMTEVRAFGRGAAARRLGCSVSAATNAMARYVGKRHAFARHSFTRQDEADAAYAQRAWRDYEANACVAA